ncbi:MAG: hypothetical protein ACUVV0_04575 [Anaerolineae bacterium]
MGKDKLPEFETLEEMAEFWETHDSADYWDEFEDVEATFEFSPQPCPRCGGRMIARGYLWHPLGHERLTIELIGYLCINPQCTFKFLSDETESYLAELKRLAQEDLGAMALSKLFPPEKEALQAEALATEQKQ